MILSEATIRILKTYADISVSFCFVPGNKMFVISAGDGKFYAVAEVAETFPMTFPIYDLKRFLSVLTLSSPADIEFNPTHLKITGYDDRMVSELEITDISFIPMPKKSNPPEFNSDDLQMIISEQDLTKIMAMARVSEAPIIAIENDTKATYLKAYDSKNANFRPTRMLLNHIGNDEPYRIDLTTTYLSKLPADTYAVSIKKAGLVRFVGNKLPITYYIGAEATSYYGEDNDKAE